MQFQTMGWFGGGEVKFYMCASQLKYYSWKDKISDSKKYLKALLEENILKCVFNFQVVSEIICVYSETIWWREKRHISNERVLLFKEQMS